VPEPQNLAAIKYLSLASISLSSRSVMGSIEILQESHLKESTYDVPSASYPKASTAPVPEHTEDIKRIASQGIDELNHVLDSKHYSTLYSLLLSSSSYWRDHLVLCNTKFSTLTGPREIVNFMEENGTICEIQKFELDGNKPPVIGRVDAAGTVKTVQAYITFETEVAKGRGLISWVQDVDDGDRWKIFTVYTALDDLKKTPFANGNNRPLYSSPHDAEDTKSWKDYREEELDFKDKEPAVLIVGTYLYLH
jgi:hypothetical protein